MTEEMALDRFADADDKAAQAAFVTLEAAARPLIDAYLRNNCRVIEGQDRADLIQETLIRLWNARAGFMNRGTGPWRAMLRRTAFRCFIDRLRRESRLPVASEWDENQIPDKDRLPAQAVLAALAADRLSHLADCLLLELDASLPPEHLERRLLAAQLFYLDGEPWHEVLYLLGPGMPGTPALDRAQLDAWLADPATLRHLAYRTLFMENQPLAAYLSRAPVTDSWTPDEQRIIRWRYGNGLLEEQIALRNDCPIARAEIRALCERCEALFPFKECMEALLHRLTAFSGEGQEPLRQGLARPGLWQRLAFEYRYREDLAHRDIQSRTRPAAQVLGTDVTEGMLNVWLSNGRLLKRLGTFAARWFGDETRESTDREERGCYVG